jgi:hypothetical protein
MKQLELCLVLFLFGCAGGNDSDPMPAAPPPTGVSISLEWNPVLDPTVTAYVVHYGPKSTNQAGSCSYDFSAKVHSPSATITHLEPNTAYYFAVSAYNGVEGPCSNEVSTHTPSSA